MTNDSVLLRQFVDGSEAAFAELVRMHIGAVHGTALRMVGGDDHLAKDVTQKVFTGLARKASTLVDRPLLLSWLYLSTHYEAAAAVRAERRWRNREQKAYAMQEIEKEGGPEPDWSALRPVIDAALLDLKDGDREALLLRFFRANTFAEVGESLGLSENAARMRVDRALDKLKDVLARRGIKSTAAALGAVIGTQLATAAPATLAATVAAAALTGASTATAATLIFMGMTKLQWGMAAVLAVAGSSALWSEHQAGTQLQAERAALAEQSAEVSQLKIENAKFEKDARAAELLRQQASLAKDLRTEESKLRSELQRAVMQRSRVAANRPTNATPPRPATSTITADGLRIYRLSELDERPAPTEQHDPEFPGGVKMDGAAVVSCVVRPDGSSSELKVEQASSEAFGEAAMKAVEKWKFKPAMKAGAAVCSRVTVPFKIGDNVETAKEWL
ncbi:MAG: TonB family protein [Nibricoccus sp.]